MGFVYGIQSGTFIKVGAAFHLGGRLQTFRLYNPHPLKVILQQTVAEYYWAERRMHQLLSPFAIGREWFDCSPEIVRQAWTVTYADLIAHRHAQGEWETTSVAKAAKRAAERAARLGSEWGKTHLNGNSST